MLACGSGSENGRRDLALGVEARGPRAERIVSLLGLPPGRSSAGALLVLLVDADSTEDLAPEKVARAIEVDVHQVEEGHALVRQIAEIGGRREAAERHVRAVHRPLVERAAHHLGKRRPCVAVVVGLDPLRLAGGHSFETDLVQALGAESATHGGEKPVDVVGEGALSERPVDLVLATRDALDAPALLALLTRRLEGVPVARVPALGDRLWLGRPDEIESLLDAWEPAIEAARDRPAREGTCARTPGRAGRGP